VLLHGEPSWSASGVWLRFREVVRTAPALSVSRLVQSGCQTTLPP
jgi:hypothetical protein